MGSKKAKTMFGPNTAHLNLLRDIVEAGEMKSVIDRAYPLEQTAEAHRYYDRGHTTGKIVITVP